MRALGSLEIGYLVTSIVLWQPEQVMHLWRTDDGTRAETNTHAFFTGAFKCFFSEARLMDINYSVARRTSVSICF